MRYKLQTSFFGGDATFIDDTGTTFNTIDEAIEYVLTHNPPSEFEWRVDEGGAPVVWTRYGGEEVMAWREGRGIGKIVTVRVHNPAKELFQRLEKLIKPEALSEWMEVANPAFDGRTPNDLVKSGELKPLWEMVYRLESGEAS